MQLTVLRRPAAQALTTKWLPHRFGFLSHPQRRAFSSKKANNDQSRLLRSLRGLSNENDDGSNEKEGQTSSAVPLRRTKKKLTLDEFFDDLGKQQQSKKDGRQSQTNRKSSRTRLDPIRKSDEPRRNPSDMASFFDQVDALMEKNKRGEVSDSISSLRSKKPLSSSKSQEEETIFDILQPAMEDSAPSQPKSTFYDNSSFQQYLEVLEHVMERPEFLKKHTRKPLSEEEATQIIEWLQSTEPSVEVKLPMLDAALEDGNADDNDDNSGENSIQQSKVQQAEAFRDEVGKQRELFMAHHGWTDKQYKAAMGALVSLGNMSARKCQAAPLEVAWQKLKEAGFRMDKKTLHNYLYVSSTFSLPSARRLSSLTRHSRKSLGGSVLDFLGEISDDSDGMDSGSSKEKDTTVDVSAEVALCHNFLFEPTEQSTSIHVRVLVSQGKPNEAERVLDENTKNDDLRLRTYAPVYDAYLDMDDVVSAFKLFVKMKNEKHVELLPETYVQLIACIAENGYFKEESDDIEVCKELGYPAGSGAALFDALASELAQNSIEITSASAKQLYNAFQRGFQGEEGASSLQSMHVFESFQPNNDPAASGELIVSRVAIDERSGKCARSRSKLRLIGLHDDQKMQFQEGLLKLCASAYEERHEKKGTKKVVNALRNFGKWLKDREGDPFTAILDGANIAYYMQNFDKGRFSYHQIQFVVDALEEMGENVLVVLPQKYVQDTFQFLTHYTEKHQRLRKAEREIRDRLNAEGKICVVPMGSLDDYYWMYASVSTKEEYVPPGNAKGRWPGTRPMLVSNDKLRDHRMALLEPRLFRRWFSSFLVNFTFSAFVDGECVDREIGFRTADFYSREIQGNPSFDENGVIAGIVWHFPVADWNENECLCLRIPSKEG